MSSGVNPYYDQLRRNAMKIAQSIIALTSSALMIGGLMSAASAATVHTNTSNAHRNDVYDVYKEVTPLPSVEVHTKTCNAHRNDVYDLYRETKCAEPEPVGINTSNAHRNDVYDIYQK